jgi:hypothetical protein
MLPAGDTREGRVATLPSNSRQEMFSRVDAGLRAEDGNPLFYFSNKLEGR